MKRAAKTGAPRIPLGDINKMTYLQSDDHSLCYREGDTFRNIPNCKVRLHDILDFGDSAPHCDITLCNTKKLHNISNFNYRSPI